MKNPAVDEAVEGLISAPDRKALVTRTRVLDRLLQCGHYLIPQWHIGYDRYAYWDRFGIPDTIPMKGVSSSYWWIDPAKDAALGNVRGK